MTGVTDFFKRLFASKDDNRPQYVGDPLDLLEARQYQAAIDAYAARLAADAEDFVAESGLAASLFSIGRYRHSIPLFWQIDEKDRIRLSGHCGQGIKISCAHWCLGERAEALRIMRGQCAGILDRSVTYSPDGASGATMGLLLHYMAVTSGDAAETAYAVKYLENRNNFYVKRAFDTPWPSHAVKYSLGHIDFDYMLECAGQPADLDQAIAEAMREDKLLQRRQLCEALFTAAVICRKQGDEAGAMRWFEAVYALPDPIVEQEWYLARYECGG